MTWHGHDDGRGGGWARRMGRKGRRTLRRKDVRAIGRPRRLDAAVRIVQGNAPACCASARRAGLGPRRRPPSPRARGPRPVRCARPRPKPPAHRGSRALPLASPTSPRLYVAGADSFVHVAQRPVHPWPGPLCAAAFWGRCSDGASPLAWVRRSLSSAQRAWTASRALPAPCSRRGRDDGQIRGARHYPHYAARARSRGPARVEGDRAGLRFTITPLSRPPPVGDVVGPSGGGREDIARQDRDSSIPQPMMRATRPPSRRKPPARLESTPRLDDEPRLGGGPWWTCGQPSSGWGWAARPRARMGPSRRAPASRLC